MAAGSKQQALQQLWSSVRVLVVEEISMVSALLYNMLDFRAMIGRGAMFKVTAHTYTRTGHAFGRVPIVLHLGDFFQLRPTAQLSLLDDLDAKDKDGNNVYCTLMCQRKCSMHKTCLAPYLMSLSFAGRCVSSRAFD